MSPVLRSITASRAGRKDVPCQIFRLRATCGPDTLLISVQSLEIWFNMTWVPVGAKLSSHHPMVLTSMTSCIPILQPLQVTSISLCTGKPHWAKGEERNVEVCPRIQR